MAITGISAPVAVGTGTGLPGTLTDAIELERTEVLESKVATHLRFRLVT